MRFRYHSVSSFYVTCNIALLQWEISCHTPRKSCSCEGDVYTENSSKPILCICGYITIEITLNFDVDTNANVTYKQTFKEATPEMIASSYYSLIVLLSLLESSAEMNGQKISIEVLPVAFFLCIWEV